jgi:hypothetical protein
MHDTCEVSEAQVGGLSEVQWWNGKRRGHGKSESRERVKARLGTSVTLGLSPLIFINQPTKVNFYWPYHRPTKVMVTFVSCIKPTKDNVLPLTY